MKKRLLIDFFFLPKLGKFYSFNVVGAEMLLLLASLDQYDIDVIVHIGEPFQALSGEEAADLVWQRHYHEVFDPSLREKLKIRQAIAHENFHGHMKAYDLLIQMVSCYELRRVIGVPAIVIHHDLIPVEGLYDVSVRSVIEPLLTNTSGHYIACTSKPVHDHLIQCLPHTKGRSAILPITFNRFAQESKPLSFADTVSRHASKKLNREKLDAGQTPRYILQIGSFEADFDRKNHALTLAAWEKYRALYPDEDVKLVFIGGVHMGNDELFMYHNLGSLDPKKLSFYLEEGEIIMLTNVDQDEMVGLIQETQCFVLPSKSEGFGMPVIEAMHGGCPVIVSDTEIFRWVAGEAALFCDPYDVDSLVSCFDQLLKNQEIRQTLIEKGYENIKRFSSESVGPLWEQFIGKIVSHHSLEGANELTLAPS